jgi:hypothetical protein
MSILPLSACALRISQSRRAGATLGRWALGLGLGLLAPAALQAQSLNYQATGAANVAGTYTDLGTTGTVIATSGTDDALSASQALPFNFSYNGTTFTDFSLSTNGFIKLGTTPLSAATLVNAIGSADPADINILAPLSNIDLQTAATATAEYRYAVTGTAPARVATIQWKNVADKLSTSAPAQFASMQFQVKLYEGSNRVEFVYGTWVANAATPTGQPFVVGLKGSSNAIADRLFASKPSSATAWSTTTFSPGTTTQLLAHFVRNTFLPDAGRTYRFAPSAANDAGVTAIYTLGKVSSTYGSPVTVQAVISNTGSNAQTALPVTLTVSGATTFTNTQTVASLAAGASTTVTFTAYPITGTTGTNTLTVAVPADAATGNDSKNYSQLITAGDQSYIDSSQPLNATGVGVGAANGVLLVRQHTNSPAVVSSITPTFVAATGASTTYQVVIYDATGTGGTPGTALYTSPTQTRPASGPAVVSIPNIPVTGDFFIGTKELDANNIVIGYQVESPLKTATYYFTTDGSTWNDVSLTTLQTRLALEVGLSSPSAATCAPVTALAVSSITDNTASVSFTPGTGNTSYTVTYTPAGGTATTITPAPIASPVALTGLTAGTVYTVSVTPICSAGGTATATTTTFTTTGGATCPPVTGASVGSITFTSGSLIFTPAAGAVDYDLTLDTTVGSGSPATVTVAGSPVNLTNLTPGTSYTITITTNCASGVSSVVTVVFTTNTPSAPANDDCLGATPLTVVAGACTAPTTGTNLGATSSTNVANPTCSNFSGGDVWFSFVAPTNGIVNIETGSVSGSDVTDTGVALYTGSCGNLTEVDCDDDSSTGFFSLINATGLTPGNTYYVRVFDYANAEFGDFTICATTAVPCPAVTDLLATSSAIGNSTSIAFTPSTPATSYTVTYAATGGATQTVTTPVTASPIVLSGLTPYTSYSITVVGNCGGGLTSAPATLTFLTTPYCNGTADGLGGDCSATSISTVAIAGTTLNNANNGCTSVETSTFPAAYSAFPTTSTNTASLTAGQSYQLSVTTSDDAITSVWVDFDHNGTFDASEWTQVSTTSNAGTATTVALAVPAAAVPGVTGMRVRSRATGNSNGAGDACSDFLSGEAEDYLVTILAPTATHSALAGGFVSVYPNPAHQSFTVTIPAVSSARKAQVDIINTLGQVVRTQAVNLNTTLTQATIDAANLATGLYTVRVRTGQETATVRLTIQ